MCGLLLAAKPVIALPPFLSYNRTEEEVTALVSPKDGFPDSATAAPPSPLLLMAEEGRDFIRPFDLVVELHILGGNIILISMLSTKICHEHGRSL